MTERIDVQWPYKRKWYSKSALSAYLFLEMSLGLVSMSFGLCLPIHFGALFAVGAGPGIVLLLAVALVDWFKPESQRVALSESGVVLPDFGKVQREVEVEYWAIDELWLKHNCQGRQLVIGYSRGAKVIFEEHLPSRKAFKKLRQMVAERIWHARRARQLPAARRVPVCLPNVRTILLDFRKRTHAWGHYSSKWFYFPKGSQWVELDVFFTLPVLQHWKEHGTILLPGCCCRCLQPAELWRDCVRRERFRSWCLRAVPYCQLHGANGEPDGMSIRSYLQLQNETIGLSLTVENPEFAIRVFELNHKGDAPVPWVVCAGKCLPSKDWLGVDCSAMWFCYFWLVFWDKLSAEGKATYLDRYQAPESWREFLSQIELEAKP